MSRKRWFNPLCNLWRSLLTIEVNEYLSTLNQGAFLCLYSNVNVYIRSSSRVSTRFSVSLATVKVNRLFRKLVLSPFFLIQYLSNSIIVIMFQDRICVTRMTYEFNLLFLLKLSILMPSKLKWKPLLWRLAEGVQAETSCYWSSEAASNLSVPVA